MSASGWVHLEVLLVKRITEAAALLVIEDVDDDIWIPLSQMHDPDVIEEGDQDITVTVTEWIAKEKGLE